LHCFIYKIVNNNIAMFFTQEDFRKIEQYLKENARKDTDFIEA
jgi:hypothetical protein